MIKTCDDPWKDQIRSKKHRAYMKHIMNLGKTTEAEKQHIQIIAIVTFISLWPTLLRVWCYVL